MSDNERLAAGAAEDGLPAPADRLTDSTYVRFCEGLAVLTEADRVIVTGGMKRHLFSGSDARRVVAELVPLLDGRRTLAEASSTSGMVNETARQAVSMFRNFGLVEYADTPFEAGTSPAPHASAFLSSAVHAAGTYRNSQDSFEALARSAVLIHATGPAAEPLRADLLACGIGSVVIGDVADATEAKAAVAGVARWPQSLVVAVEDRQTPAALTGIETACREQGVMLLRAARRGATVEVGPLFVGGHTACYECFSRGRDQYFAGLSAMSALPGNTSSWAADAVLAAMVAGEALAVLGHIKSPRSYRAVTVMSLTDYSDRRLTVFPSPDCPVCGGLYPCEDEADAAAVYEWEAQKAPFGLLSAAAHATLARPEIAELATMRPNFIASPSFPLPLTAQSGDPGTHQEAASSPPLGTAQLARILSGVAGRRAPGHPSDLSRWSASGGNLASVRLYAVAAGSGFGAAAEQLTVYDDMEHRLTVVRNGRVSVSDLLAETGLTAAEPAAVLVFVADVARIARKYSGFGYRLSHLDAGVAAAQLIAITQELGLTVTFAPAWSPGLAGRLELWPDHEYITALAVLTPQKGLADAADS